jgi:NADH-quinone oxidoreductase subunit M
MAVFFLLTALASIGFPGTIGFVGAELLVEGVVQLTPIIGMLVVLTGALNGIAVLRTYFKLFTGTRHTTSISLEARVPEKIAVLAMTLLILGGGLWPQPGVASRCYQRGDVAGGMSTESGRNIYECQYTFSYG